MKADKPTELGYQSAAWLLMVDTPAMQAVGEVEAGPLGAFNDDGSPVILYEPHIFRRLTKGHFGGSRAPGIDGVAGELSRIEWKPGTYGPNSIQHQRLSAAAELDRDAALKSCSWGLFQILGENHSLAGYRTIQSFVNAMYRSADDHLRAFVTFLHSDEARVDALRSHNWAEFARLYNGAAYKENKYDEKLRAAYERITSAAA